MKQSHTCPKCSSQKIGYLENVIHRAEVFVEGADRIGHSEAPLGIQRTESQGFIKVIKEEPAGSLEAYFCTDCGYYETYVKDSASLQFDSIVGFSWVNG
jgi:predicted nucleic-acid-binding Zn-ribbon protein